MDVFLEKERKAWFPNHVRSLMENRDKYENLAEKQVSSEEIFDGTVLHVFRDIVKLPDGNEAHREVIRHIGAVCVIPVTDDEKVIVEKQYRYPADSVFVEIPAGKLDYKEEDRLEAAKRELKEETGITAKRWTNIGVFYGAPAYSDERITMYLAENLEFGEQKLDDDEFLMVEAVPLQDLVDDVMMGRITDAKTQVAILKADKIINGK